MKVYLVMKAMYDDFDVCLVTLDKAEAEAAEKALGAKDKDYMYFVKEAVMGEMME